MMKKSILLLIGLCLFTAQLDAQVAFATARELAMISRGVAKSVRKGNPLYIPGKSFVGRTGLYPFQVTRVLQRRAAKAQRRAAIAHKALPWNKKTISGYLPAAKFRYNNPTVQPFLQTAPVRNSKQIALYLTAQENRLYAQEVWRRYPQVWAQLAENLPRLRQAAQDSAIPPSQPLTFLAQTIPGEVNTIALGEVHGLKEIRTFIAQFLSALRQTRPQQEIFIFTEALAQGQEFLHPNGKYSVLPEGGMFGLEQIWKTARENHIPIIGLEPKEVKQELHVKQYARFEHPQGRGGFITPFFASLTGMRWRNQAFTKTLQAYREKHPDALFIIHTGGAHVDYTAPFSLTAKMDPQKTFVLRFLPTLEQVKQNFPEKSIWENHFMWDPLGNELNGIESFEQPFLFFRDSQLARIAGADAYLQTNESFLKPRTR